LPGIQAAIAGGFDVFGFANDRNKAAFEEWGAKTFFSMNELNWWLKI